LFVKNPGKDFTRNRKLPLETMLKLLISIGGGSLAKELLTFHNFDSNTATSSAFIQQREKLLPCAFEFLLHEFTATAPPKYYHGYRLLTADGSDVHIPTNPEHADSYFSGVDHAKGYNLLHLNAIYDLCSKLFVDVLLQPCKRLNEHLALTAMTDRSHITGKVILVADRGYESYNNIAHLEQKGWNYVIRVRDKSGMVSRLCLPETDEFDVPVSFSLTRKQTNQVKSQPECYRVLPSTTHFDYLDDAHRLYSIAFRVVRLRIADNCYETLFTNLNPCEFPASVLKDIYRLRWGVETSFRELKYAVGLLNFHSKKVEYVMQEIFAQLIMYNFSMMITSHVIIQQRGTKYAYQVNFTQAIHICGFYFRCSSGTPPDIEALMRRYILPIRPGRSDRRNIRYHSAVSFLYRVA
jgi:hypothetical protein